ncbi:hypothetical protein SDC9_21464 [bioreactor metagenome]|uniref:Uncharacterized protein n=2 Tax=root TaxID=1 RepID=A0A644U9K7_9ZZZZ
MSLNPQIQLLDNMITSKNIFHHELIGLNLKVFNSSNNFLIGISGKIIDERKKTITIETEDNGIKIIPKNVSIFHLFLPNGELVEIDGKILVNRPEDRIKKKYKKL